MQNRLDRAKQFLAFDALSGYGSLINKTKNIKYKDKLIYLDDDYNNHREIDEITALKGNAKTETLKAKLMFTKENIIAEHRQI